MVLMACNGTRSSLMPNCLTSPPSFLILFQILLVLVSENPTANIDFEVDEVASPVIVKGPCIERVCVGGGESEEDDGWGVEEVSLRLRYDLFRHYNTKSWSGSSLHSSTAFLPTYRTIYLKFCVYDFTSLRLN